MNRIDLRRLRLIFGIGLKTLGYMTIAAGIFLSIGNRDVALKVVVFGALMVIFGWGLIIKALRG